MLDIGGKKRIAALEQELAESEKDIAILSQGIYSRDHDIQELWRKNSALSRQVDGLEFLLRCAQKQLLRAKAEREITKITISVDIDISQGD